MLKNKKGFKNERLLAASALTIGAVLAISASAQAETNYTYYGYDMDNDGYLEETEYVRYSYDLIDYDDDGVIDEGEWDDYTSVWYDPYDIDYGYGNAFSDYDVDNDGNLEMNEYTTAYDDNLYDMWDIDGDGYVEAYEYDQVASTYIDYDDDGLYEW